MKIIALAVILFAIYLFYYGVRYKEPRESAAPYLTQIKFIGSAMLLGILGYYLFRGK